MVYIFIPDSQCVARSTAVSMPWPPFMLSIFVTRSQQAQILLEGSNFQKITNYPKVGIIIDSSFVYDKQVRVCLYIVLTCFFQIIRIDRITSTHWTYLLHILSKLCFQWLASSENYEIMTISTYKNTLFNDLDYKADIGQHFHKSEKSTRWRHCQEIIKTNLKTLYLHY